MPLDDSAHQLGDAVRFILCHHRRIAYRLDPRPQAKLARHLRVLLREDLPGFQQPKYLSSVNLGYTACILSTELCHLGELTLAVELGS